MFVFQFEDGRYYKQPTHLNISSKPQVDRWKGYVFTGEKEPYYDQLMRHTEEYKTTNLDEAKVFNSLNAVRSSNCYSWGGKALEVTVTIKLKS
jgi:hypothetical protein